MLNRTSAFLPALFLAFGLVSNSNAVEIMLGPNDDRVLVVTFDMPAQPPINNGVTISVDGYEFRGSMLAEIRLYDQFGLLGRGVIDEHFSEGFWVAPDSAWVGKDGVFVVDFSRLANGATNVRFEFEVLSGTPNAYIMMDSTSVIGYPIGDEGAFYAFSPTITSVQSFPTSPIPEPTTVSLMALGLAAGAWRQRRRASS